jgi:hypothetical protein
LAGSVTYRCEPTIGGLQEIVKQPLWNALFASVLFAATAEPTDGVLYGTLGSLVPWPSPKKLGTAGISPLYGSGLPHG